MTAAWRTWVGLWQHHEHPRSLAMVRILLAAVMLWDFAWIGALDLVPALFSPEEAGGWGRVLHRDYVPAWWLVFPPTPWSAWAAWGVAVASLVGLLTGTFTRVSALTFVLISAQLAMTLDAADRGIDMMVRNVVLILLFSKSHATWSVDAWRATGHWSGDHAPVPAWPRHLLVLQLVVMYFVAGIAKLGAGWTFLGGYSALYMILQDAAVARFDVRGLTWLYPFTQFGTFVTIVWEYSSPIVLWFYWLRHTHARGGRWRVLARRWQPHLWWAFVGVLFHGLIALTLNLGIFPFAMLALYPAFVHPTQWPSFLRSPHDHHPDP